MIGLVVIIIFAFIWYVPFCRKAKDRTVSGKRLAAAFILGALIAYPLSAFTQLGIAAILLKLKASELAGKLVVTTVGAGIFEEVFKFLVAKLTLKKKEEYNILDYIILFGTVGLGFEVIETVLGTSNVIGSVLRGILMLHVIFQFYMGYQYYEYRESSEKKHLVKCFAFPMLVHALFDDAITVISYAAGAEVLDAPQLAAIVIALFVMLVPAAIIAVKTIKQNRRALAMVKEQKALGFENAVESTTAYVTESGDTASEGTESEGTATEGIASEYPAE